MWVVVIVDGKIKHADVYGPFADYVAAQQFADSIRWGDKAVTQLADPATYGEGE